MKKNKLISKCLKGSAILFAGAVCITGVSMVKGNSAAAVADVIELSFANSVSEGTMDVDVDGDGVADKIAVTSTIDNDSYGLSNLKMTINGNSVMTFPSDSGYSFTIEYVKGADNTEEYLHIKNTFENEDPGIDGIYAYNSSTKKLDNLVAFDSTNWPKGSFHIYTGKVKGGKGSIEVEYSGQMVATGYINYTYKYVLKNGKFVLSGDTVKVNKAKNYKTASDVKFYKKAGSKKVAFTVKKGKKVKIQKVRKYKKEYFLQFKCGKKTGWLPAETDGPFKGVMLAG